MAPKRSLLVVANVTATAPELHDALTERAKREPLRLTLLVPAHAGDEAAAQERLSKALKAFSDHGLEADGLLGDDDPAVAVAEAWDPRRFDEVLISTLPAGASKWLEGGLPARIRRLTDAQVTQQVCQPAKPVPVHIEEPEPEHLNILSPFAALASHKH
ncbi:MAG: hypothetical protein J2O48_06515 [Solirubrobacterales bacterium]|nr:hypothetical protein [Solirubrobacterales bacterium]